MNPKEAGSRLAGVRYGKLQRIGDRRGSFAELWRASTFGELGLDVAGLPDARFVQANLSTSARACCAGSTTTAASSTTGPSSAAGRWSPSST